MHYAVRVTDDYVGLMGRYVAEGQTIVPGAPLLDVMTPEGIVRTIMSEGWGIVAHIEGGRIFPNANSNEERAEDDDEDDDDTGESGSARSSSGGSGSVFPKGSVICHIVGRDGREAGTVKGLTPRPTTVIARRIARGLNLV
jgi:hypothetical protein